MRTAFDVSWGGTDLCAEFGLYIEYGSISCDPPAPKTYVVEVPGGVDIDLTDALTGHAAYGRRKVAFSLLYDGRGGRPWQDVAREVVQLLHGMEADFSLSWDPGFTYHGRATVTSAAFVPRSSCRISVEIDASPWKVREVHTEAVSAVGGAKVTCRSGRRPVHPLISCDYPVTVEWRGDRFTVPAGRTYRMAAVTFTEGDNDIWLSIYSYRPASWADLAGLTWDDVGGSSWAGISVADGEQDPGTFIGDGTVVLQWEEAYL